MPRMKRDIYDNVEALKPRRWKFVLRCALWMKRVKLISGENAKRLFTHKQTAYTALCLPCPVTRCFFGRTLYTTTHDFDVSPPWWRCCWHGTCAFFTSHRRLRHSSRSPRMLQQWAFPSALWESRRPRFFRVALNLRPWR